MTNDKIIKLLKIEKECVAHSGECNRQCMIARYTLLNPYFHN